MNTFGDFPAILGALADWVDDSLAGGDPPKWVAREAALAVRAVAEEAGRAGAVTGDDGWGPVADDVTMMLRRRPENLPSVHRGWRAVRYARRWVARMRIRS